MIILLGLAVIAFFSTNIDNIFLLLIFFADRKFRVRDIVVGQYISATALYGLSVLCSLTALVIPRVYIGMLGLVPIVIGARKLYLRYVKDKEVPLPKHFNTGSHGHILSVAAVTMAVGSDNIAVYVPLFTTRSSYETAVIGLVFAAMTAVWCFLAHWMVKHPALGPPMRHYGNRVVPFVLIGLGMLLLFQAGSFKLLAGHV